MSGDLHSMLSSGFACASMGKRMAVSVGNNVAHYRLGKRIGEVAMRDEGQGDLDCDDCPRKGQEESKALSELCPGRVSSGQQNLPLHSRAMMMTSILCELPSVSRARSTPIRFSA